MCTVALVLGDDPLSQAFYRSCADLDAVTHLSQAFRGLLGSTAPSLTLFFFPARGGEGKFQNVNTRRCPARLPQISWAIGV